MSKFNCPCGNELSNVTVPTPHDAWLITDRAWDAHCDYGAKPTVLSWDVPRRRVMECRDCGRIFISKELGGNAFVSFVPEGRRLEFFNDGEG